MIVYSADSQVRRPGLLARAMLSDLARARELSWRLFVRDISALYRQSVLGVLWSFAPPVVTALIFILLQRSSVLNLAETSIPYPVYVLTGTILWQVFTESLNAPLRSAKASQSLLVRVNFPREALIISATLVVLFNLLIKVVVLAGLFLVFGVPLTWGVLVASVPVLMLVFLGIGAGMLLVPVGMLYSDVTAALPTLTQILFFLTPVVYAPPQTFPLSLIVALNPVSPLLIAARDLAVQGQLLNPGPFLLASALALLLLLAGWIIYRISLPIVIERVGA